MSAHQDSPQRMEAGYQAWAGGSLALLPTSVPQAPGATPFSCPTSWLAAWRADGTAWRLGVLALGPPDNPLAQCLEIEEQAREGHRLRSDAGDRGRWCKYKDSDIKLRALKVKA